MSDDVQRAIEVLQNGISYNIKAGGHKMLAIIDNPSEFSDAIDIIITALTAYQQPTSEAVQRAIEELQMLSEVWDEIGQPTEVLKIAITALRQIQEPTIGDLAMSELNRFSENNPMKPEPEPINWIEAQRAYRANGCKPVIMQDGLYEAEIRRKYDKQMTAEPCDWCCGEDRFECYLIDDDGNTISIKDNVVQTVIAHFCPNCGRRLGVE